MVFENHVTGYLKTLQSRGSHRLSGSPAFGSITVFLNGIFFIRMGVNLALIIDLAGRGARFDIPQIAGTYSLIIYAYLTLVGSLSIHRVGLALPDVSFISFAPRGREFKMRYLIRSAVRRPLLIAAFVLLLASAMVLSLISGSWQATLLEYVVVFLLASLTMSATVAIAVRNLRSVSDTQVLEFLILVILVTRNPDIGSHRELVSLAIAGRYYPLSQTVAFFSAIGVVTAIGPLLLLLERFLSSLKHYFGRIGSMSPVVRWYWRSVKIRFWVIVYAAVTPAFVSSLAGPGTKRWALSLSLLFGAGAYIYFVGVCEDTLRNLWRCSLFDGGNRSHLYRTAAIHAAFMSVPVAGFILDRLF